MLDFGKLVYLDVQKTGSSSVGRFLRANLTLPQLSRAPHTPAQQRLPDVFYFITVREPLAQYISLYKYGLAAHGGLYKRFIRAGMAQYYQPNLSAFERWLGFIIAPENAGFFGNRYQNTLPSMIGLQSYRFLVMSLVKPGPTLRAVRSKTDLRALYAEKKLQSRVLKTETLTQDLENLLDSEVGAFFRPREQVVSYLHNAKRAKESSVDAGFKPKEICPNLINDLKKREWFLYEHFYTQE